MSYRRLTIILEFFFTGNQAVMDEIWASAQHIEFSYIRVLKLLYSTDKTVQLLAGAALATFAYNNMSQQQLIAAEGGVRFSGFVSFLQSEDEYLRCNAAFQVRQCNHSCIRY